MSDPGNRHDLEAARRQLPGCGVALYSGLLLVFFLLGVAGIVLASMTVFSAGSGASPYVLTYGGNVEPALLEPMRSAGLLGADEVPDAFHAEDLFGTTACALLGDRFLRVGPDGAFTLPLAALTASEVEDGVQVTGDGRAVLCQFHPEEGADRLRAC